MQSKEKDSAIVMIATIKDWFVGLKNQTFATVKMTIFKNTS